jgi:murein L,D-transpeptidase YafK
MIHGLPSRQAWVGAAHRDFDWTEGCIALTNQEIEEIWSTVPVGTPINIRP